MPESPRDPFCLCEAGHASRVGCIYSFIHSIHQNFRKGLLCAKLCAGDMAVNRTDNNPFLHRAYILGGGDNLNELFGMLDSEKRNEKDRSR